MRTDRRTDVRRGKESHPSARRLAGPRRSSQVPPNARLAWEPSRLGDSAVCHPAAKNLSGTCRLEVGETRAALAPPLAWRCLAHPQTHGRASIPGYHPWPIYYTEYLCVSRTPPHPPIVTGSISDTNGHRRGDIRRGTCRRRVLVRDGRGRMAGEWSAYSDGSYTEPPAIQSRQPV